MDKQALKAFAYFMTANFQAVVLIGLAFEIVSYLDQNYPGFSWAYIVWPCCVLLIGQIYFLMARYILKTDKQKRKKQ